MTSYLRPLTYSALATLLMTAPLAGSGLDAAALHTSRGGEPAAGTTYQRAATAFPTTGLPTGAPPKIAYARATKPEFLGGNFRMHRPDGTSLRLGFLALGQWTPMGRGAFGLATTEVGPQLQRIDSSGRIVRKRFLAHFGMAVSPDHSIASWLDDQRRPHDLEGGGTREFTLPQVPRGDGVGAVSGAQTCKEQSPEGGGCTVFVNTARRNGVFVSTSHGIVTKVGPMLRVTDVNQRGRVTALLSKGTASSPPCWGVITPAGHRAFRTCRYQLDSFSTDGRLILGEHTPSASESVRRFAILRRDGSVARAFTFDIGARRSLNRLTWEDSTHLLGVLRAGGSWSIVRIGVDGTVEYAVPPTPAVNEFTPFSLPLR
ncbi:hypothetical protein [Nocardioides cynanchi]|uniref:hypothetical protein n=1 Tax=Nocardioides cynanchi TaxID=2558918 RepID=UPI00124593F7|nr:hypothetical protein [Nocardioides cynanchi]